MSETVVVPFGKHKGKPVEALLADPDYLRWVMGQPGIVQMMQAKHPTLFNIITIGAPQSDDTPDHNRLQARFTDRAFQLAFIEAATGENPMRLAEQFAAKENSETNELIRRTMSAMQRDAKSARRILETAPASSWAYEAAERELFVAAQWETHQYSEFPVIYPSILPTFECGYDVKLEVLWKVKTYTRKYNAAGSEIAIADSPPKVITDIRQRYEFSIEIKPAMGDDFPSVLRQMRNNRSYSLLVGSFNAVGASLEQVRVMFGDKKIILLAEVEAILRRPKELTQAAEEAV